MYQVESQNGEIIGKFRSVKQAHEAVQQYFQCGVSKSRIEAAKSIKICGFSSIPHIMDESITCMIEAV